MIALPRPRPAVVCSAVLVVGSFAVILIPGYFSFVYLGCWPLLTMYIGLAGIVFFRPKRETSPSQTASNIAMLTFLILAAVVKIFLYNWALNLPPA